MLPIYGAKRPPFKPLVTLLDAPDTSAFLAELYNAMHGKEAAWRRATTRSPHTARSNTRTIAVFSELYLKSLGVEVDNPPFMEHSKLFRNMLVRTSFSSVPLGVAEDPSFIEAFFENLALGTSHNLGSLDLSLHGIRVDPGLSYRGEEGASSPSPDIH